MIPQAIQSLRRAVYFRCSVLWLQRMLMTYLHSEETSEAEARRIMSRLGLVLKCTLSVKAYETCAIGPGELM